jgi:hypothetical protein
MKSQLVKIRANSCQAVSGPRSCQDGLGGGSFSLLLFFLGVLLIGLGFLAVTIWLYCHLQIEWVSSLPSFPSVKKSGLSYLCLLL